MKGHAGIAGLGRFRRFQIQVHYYRLLPASDHDGFTRLISTRVYFLMRHVGRNVDEVARSGFVGEFEFLAPAHAGMSSHDIEYGFEFTVMMRTGLGVRLDDDRSRPQLRCAGAGVRDGRGSGHAGRLRCVRIEGSGSDDLDPVLVPVHDAILPQVVRRDSVHLNMRLFKRCAACLFGVVASCFIGNCAVTSVKVLEKGAVAGNAGYEYVAGKVQFAVDPNQPRNASITDLKLGPKNARGLVEFSADLFVMRPRDPNKSNHTALVEISNRGGKGLLYEFNFAHGPFDPRSASSIGDGFLLEHGYTLVWIGWEFDVPLKPGLLRAYLPVATAMGKPITGFVRSEWTGDQLVKTISTGDKGQVGYPVLDANASGNRLFARTSVIGKRTLVPHAQWKFIDPSHVELRDGFLPGIIYDVIYETKNPTIAGLGMAGIRDFVSYLKQGGMDGSIQHTIAFGVSQSGRFLREYLYDGFNEDEQGNRVFDGVWAHVAGAGRGSFNQRFAQPSRDGHEFANVFYPVDVPPFDEESLLQKSHAEHVVPKLFLTNGSYEYWSRCASLIHTTADGKADAAPSANTRIYFFAGSQHTIGVIPEKPVPSAARHGQNVSNTNDYRYSLRALLLAMEKWVVAGDAPPPSQYPRLQAGELTSLEGLKFPHIAGVSVPSHKREAYRLNFKSEPPEVGAPFPTFVPQVNADGNERGGIRMPEIAVPLASYTGWNLRSESMGAPSELVSFLGSWIPFPRAKSGNTDPRRPVQDRYPNEPVYLQRIDEAAHQLAAAGLVLQEDLHSLHNRATREWEFYSASVQ